MSVNVEMLELADKVIGMLINNDKREGLYDHLHMDNWEWPTGVALYSMYKVYKKTNDKKYLDYLINWYDVQLAKPIPHKNVNTVCPALTMVCLYEETKNEKYVPYINMWADWVMNEMPRTQYGGMQHMTVLNRHYEQLWDDTLFMTVLFLLKAGKVFGREGYVEEAKYQFLFHIKYLQDRKTGLFYHGWTFDGRHNFAGAFWARGNSWFTSGAVEFLEIYGVDDAVSRFVKTSWVDQIKELIKYQGENGLFNTLVDIEETYYETSATAGIAYGILKGVRLGLIGEEYLEYGRKAAHAVISKIDENGMVHGVSYGTGMGKDLEHYKKIPIAPTAYGQGLTFLMLTELI
ncbi:glycoside hydrolase family 88 protein [Thermoclostridium stercorarium]|uniref:beta-galactosidase BglB n=1 Tax=Thermoclostridium stercorarium TaxID=1510 RepID=UPI002248DF67|nr:glycoside hydrolase family 88 protein [Thermoclostridium stercorarium]UZQ86582.1 glycoside hydrolase family 88 protein [Thermoclostridium stercorarium]